MVQEREPTNRTSWAACDTTPGGLGAISRFFGALGWGCFRRLCFGGFFFLVRQLFLAFGLEFPFQLFDPDGLFLDLVILAVFSAAKHRSAAKASQSVGGGQELSHFGGQK